MEEVLVMFLEEPFSIKMVVAELKDFSYWVTFFQRVRWCPRLLFLRKENLIAYNICHTRIPVAYSLR